MSLESSSRIRRVILQSFWNIPLYSLERKIRPDCHLCLISDGNGMFRIDKIATSYAYKMTFEKKIVLHDEVGF